MMDAKKDKCCDGSGLAVNENCCGFPMTAPAQMPSEPWGVTEIRKGTDGTTYRENDALEYIEALRAHTESLQAECERLCEEAETMRMQASACMTACIQNTRESVKDRIGRDNPYWTQAYGDVCDAVDREMRERQRAESAERKLTEAVAALRKYGRHKNNCKMRVFAESEWHICTCGFDEVTK